MIPSSHSSKTVFTAFAGLALSTLASFSTVVPAPVSGDLFLAFHADGGIGGSTSYIVNIGQDNLYREAAPGTNITVSGTGNIGADLVATYGSTWHSRPDLHWAIFGVRPSVSSIVYGSRERNPLDSEASPWPSLDTTSRNSTATQITSVLQSVGGYQGLDATANSPVGALQSNSGEASSYDFQTGTPGTSDFGSLSSWTNIEGNFIAGTAGTALDLFRISGSGVTTVGTFTINNSGIVKFNTIFTPNPKPEIEIIQPAGSVLVDGASKKNFGTVTVGNTSASKKFTIKNTGTAALKNLVVTISGPNKGNFIVTAPGKTKLSPGGTTTFFVSFKPGAAGLRKAEIHVASNDGDENPFDIKLTGTGVAP